MFTEATVSRNLHSDRGSLTPKSPFDFSKALDFLAAFPPMMTDDQILEQESLTKAVSIGGTTIAFNVKSTGLIKNPRLAYTVFSERPLPTGVRDAVIDRMSFFLSLSDDLEQFYRIGYGDIEFAPVIQKLYGLHQVKFLTPFECASWAILSQRYPAAAARRMKQSLTEKYGTSLNIENRQYWSFPEPGRLARVEEKELLSIVQNERRAQFLLAVAKAFSEMDERFLRTAKYDVVEEKLRSINGIGDWSSRLIMLRGLGRMEKLAVEKRLLRATSKVYGKGREVTQSVLDQMAEKYGPWKGYWAYYLRANSM